MEAAKLLLFGVAIGATIANAMGVLRAPKPDVRWTGVMFFLAVAAYAGVIAQVAPGQNGAEIPSDSALIAVLDSPLRVLSVGTVGWFWLFVQTLFGDASVRPWRLGVIAGITAVGLVAVYSPNDVSPWVWLVANVINSGLLIHAMLVVWRGWKSDLVETRRRLRGPFLMAVSIYTLVMRGFETWSTFNATPAWYLAFNATTLAIMCMLGAWVFLDPRTDLFGPPRPVVRTPADKSVSEKAALDRAALDRAARADLDRLDALMRDGVWREEGLTIASLAVRVNIPEAQLRRLINDQLGHRNFPSFVNGHRIAAAKARLADPNEARTSISAIAFDIGFASLGPFNRAFKEETGVSPSEWRRKSLGTAETQDGSA